MKIKLFKYLAVAALGCIGMAGCNSDSEPAATAQRASSFDVKEFDAGVRPQNDLYAHVNGPWISKTSIPGDETDYGTFSLMNERTEERLKGLLESAGAAGTQTATGKLLSDFYTAYMDEAGIEKAGLAPIADLVQEIDGLKTGRDVWLATARLAKLGVKMPVEFYAGADYDNPNMVVPFLNQSGLGMPDRDYYLADGATYQSTREAYRKHIDQLYALSGWGGESVGASVIALETELARAQWTNLESRDQSRVQANKMTLATAAVRAPGLEVGQWFTSFGHAQKGDFYLMQDSYFVSLKNLLDTYDIKTWKSYLKLRVLKSYARYLSKSIALENFAFDDKTLQGKQTQPARWKSAISVIGNSVGEPLGRLYVEKYFLPEDKQAVIQMIEQIRKALGELIDNSVWMSQSTKVEALKKLQKTTYKVGYPDRWRDFSALTSSATDLVGNIRRAWTFRYNYDISTLDKAPDQSVWVVPPQSLGGAFYSPTENSMLFSAGFLQAPFFDRNADAASNFGAIGIVIAHEFSHGFDDQGRKFDANGQLRDWWQPEDAKKFDAITRKLVTQFSLYEPLPGLRVNGELTLGENISDLAGATIAHRAFNNSLAGQPSPIIDGLTGSQRFFLSYAYSSRNKMREEKLRQYILTDNHAPWDLRVNGTIRNMPEFHNAFGTAAGDKLYVQPGDRIQIWQ
jgi:putative endopeptidase